MELRPLHPEFGAEVLGFDLQSERSPERIAALRGAWVEHGLLLLRGGGALSPERHVEIAGWFGPPFPDASEGAGAGVGVLANDEESGRMRLLFHSDFTYTDFPVDAILLQARSLPESVTTTSFVSAAAAWDRLDEATRAVIGERKALHRLDMKITGYDWPVFEAEHPIRKRHPNSGRDVLFVTEHHAVAVEGMDEAAGRALLEGLFAELYAPEHVYVHRWELGDLLVIDNIALQHARTEEADPARGKRSLQRVALARRSPDELVEIARRQAASAAP